MSAAALAERDCYPGTSTEITVHQVTQVTESDPGDIFARPRDKYQINGRKFECYAIGVLAKALDGRQPVTIRMWEREGLFPRPTFRSPKRQGEGTARLYTREQIEGVVQIAKEEGVYARDSKISIKDTDFTERVVELFREIEASYRSAKP